MEKGYVESRAIVLLLLGAAGAGKSHFKHLILHFPPPAVRESTPLAEAAIRAISICRATIGDGDMEWQLVSSQELLRMVADAIKAGVPVRLFPLAHFPVHELPQAVYSDLTQITQPDVSLSQSSSKSQRSAPPTERAPVLPTLDPSPFPRSVSSMLEFLDLGQPSQVQLEKELVDLISQSSGSRKLFDVDWVYIVYMKFSQPASAMLLLVSLSQGWISVSLTTQQLSIMAKMDSGMGFPIAHFSHTSRYCSIASKHSSLVVALLRAPRVVQWCL